MISKYKCYPLKNFINQIRGVSYKKNQISEKTIDGYIPLLRATNIQNGEIIYQDVLYVDSSLVKLEQKLRKGDILIAASSGSKEVVGKSGQANEDCEYTFGAFCKLIRPKQNINADYLRHFFNTDYYSRTILQSINGANINNLRNEHIDDLMIPIPSLEIQSKIAALLNKTQDVIKCRKAQIDLLDQLTQSIFFEMFGDPETNPNGWEYKKLSEICQNLDSKRVPITSSERKKGIYPYYGASGIVDYVDDYIFDDNLLLVSEDGANLLSRVTPIAFEVKGKIWVNNHAHVLKFEHLSTQRFIKYVINLQDISHLITGSAQPKLNQKNLNSCMVPYPPLELQNEFYEKVEKIEEQRKVFESSLLELENLYHVLLQKSFRGELFSEEEVSII
ncbi:restriction endonuclease subunit S [Ureibacillus sp. FSL K6-2830]|uniref:restriction endonuclease subunit S n=1 Tax=Ureibacillus sp. FSL K6-2830 TaxID=2954610 RepID=UPI0030F54686